MEPGLKPGRRLLVLGRFFREMKVLSLSHLNDLWCWILLLDPSFAWMWALPWCPMSLLRLDSCWLLFHSCFDDYFHSLCRPSFLVWKVPLLVSNVRYVLISNMSSRDIFTAARVKTPATVVLWEYLCVFVRVLWFLLHLVWHPFSMFLFVHWLLSNHWGIFLLIVTTTLIAGATLNHIACIPRINCRLVLVCN